ncbi:MAG: peptidylprolyl isomerase, partial [Vicinamibacterales bacterium]
GVADPVTLRTAFGDGDEHVRRLAGIAAAKTQPLDTRLFERAIRDQSPIVRASALAALAARRAPETCGYVALGLQDAEPSVVIAALDLAADACAGQRALVATVTAAANRLAVAQAPTSSAGPVVGESAIGLSFRSTRRAPWQVGAQALITLASLAPDDARERVKAASTDSRPGVRRAAVTAGQRLREIDVLRLLAMDPEPAVGLAAAAALRDLDPTSVDGMVPSTTSDRLPAQPSASDLETLNSARLIVTVRDVGRFEIRLLPQEAPLHAWWFYRMARDKALNGLTVGRSAALAAATVRAEGAASNWGARPERAEESLQVVGRGTVGVRRRAGAAAVVFLGVADDPEAETETTVFGQIERGIEVVDALFPADVIERVEISTRPE